MSDTTKMPRIDEPTVQMNKVAAASDEATVQMSEATVTAGEPTVQLSKATAAPGEPTAVMQQQTGASDEMTAVMHEVPVENINTATVCDERAVASDDSTMPVNHMRGSSDEPTVAGDQKTTDAADSISKLNQPIAQFAQHDTTLGSQVPLYSAEPPRMQGASQSGMSSQSGAPQQGIPMNPGNMNGFQQPPVYPYVQVPRQAPMQRPVVHPKGPSAMTIVLGVLMILLGLFTAMFGYWMPINLSRFEPHVLIAVAFGGIGAILLVAAIIWGVVKAIGNRKTTKPAESDAKTGEADRKSHW